jgi:hypothetical protein
MLLTLQRGNSPKSVPNESHLSIQQFASERDQFTTKVYGVEIKREPRFGCFRTHGFDLGERACIAGYEQHSAGAGTGQRSCWHAGLRHVQQPI